MADGQNPRTPKDLQGILKICAQAQNNASQDGADSSERTGEQDKQWLSTALDSMSVNPVDRMKECLCVLRLDDKSEGTFEQQITALEELMEWCEGIDCAMDYHKIGGFSVLPALMSHSNIEIRRLTMEFLGILAQNNPYCQNAMKEAGYLPVLLRTLDSDPDETLTVKALYAISCLIRDNDDMVPYFTDNDGFSFIMRAMQTDIEKLKIKSAFFLAAVCLGNSKVKDVLYDMGVIEQLVSLLSTEHSAFHEHLLNALVTIVTDHPKSMSECMRSEFNLHNLLEERISFLNNKEEFLEEKDYAQRLLTILNNYSHADTDAVR